MKKSQKYESGYAFWLDLVIQFGKKDAVQVASNYFDCPFRDGDTEEVKFREELRDAMEGAA